MSSNGWRGVGTAVAHADSRNAEAITRAFTGRIVSSRHGPRPAPAPFIVARTARDPGARSGAHRRARARALRRRSAGHGGTLGNTDWLRRGTGTSPARPVRPARQPDRGIPLAR